jgi:hypothetical protein
MLWYLFVTAVDPPSQFAPLIVMQFVDLDFTEGDRSEGGGREVRCDVKVQEKKIQQL